MKLAALTFYKLNKKFLIKTNGEIWKFNVKKDKNLQNTMNIKNVYFGKKKNI
jgi:hypothetical protein